MKKLISIILLATILLQSCVVYQKTSVSLSEASDMGKAKVKPTYGKHIRYKKIYLNLTDSTYYGVRGGVDTPLYPAQISTIQLQNIKMSRWTTAIVLVSFSVVVTLSFVAVWNQFLEDL